MASTLGSGDPVASRQPTALEIRVAKHRGQPVVALIGELDVASAGDVRLALEPLLADAHTLVVDATELTFADATGLDVLLAAARQLRSHGGRLVLQHPARIVRRVIDLLELDRVFELQS